MEENMKIEESAVETVEEKDVNPVETLINEDNLETFKLLNMVSQLDDMKRLASDIKTKAVGPVEGDGADDFIAIIDSRVENLTVEDVKKMTSDDIYKIYTSDEGVRFEFVELDNPAKDLEFKRDFLILRIESNKAIADIDAEIAKFEETISEYEEEISELTSKFSNMNEYIKSYLAEKRDAAETEDEKHKYNSMLIALDNALTLTNVKEFYKNQMNRINLIPNFVMPKKTATVYKRYDTVRKQLKMKSNLFSFGNIEKNYFPDKYHERNNLFVFAIINMAATWSTKDKDKLMNGLFLSQFSVNLKNLIYDKFDTEEEKATFMSAACEILDMVM